MIEEALMNYGVLGLWTISLLYQQWKNMTKLTKTIENNTQALTKVYATIGGCRKR